MSSTKRICVTESLPSLCGLTCVVTWRGSNAPICTIEPDMSKVSLDLDVNLRSKNLQTMISKHMPPDKVSSKYGSRSIQMFLAETGAEMSLDPSNVEQPGFKDVWKSLRLKMLNAVLDYESSNHNLATPRATTIVHVQVSKYSMSRFALGIIRRSSYWDYRTFQQLDPEVQTNTNVAYESVCRNIETYLALNSDLKQNRKIALAAVQKKASLMTLCPLRTDKYFILEAMQAYSWPALMLKHIPDGLKYDKPFVLKAVSLDGTCFQWVAPELQKDKEVALAAVSQDRQVFELLCSALQTDKDILALLNQ